MENSTHPLLNSIFSETHQELQTLQNDFLNLQIHFVNTNYENSQLEDYNEILEEDENDDSNELLCISEYQLQKYHQIYNNIKIVDNLEEDNLNNNEFEKLKTTINNNEETFIKQINSFLMGYFIGISNIKNTSKDNKRIRISYNYSFDSEEICLQAFKFIYGIGSTKIENIRTHLSQEDIKARIHKSSGKPSHTAIPFFTVIRIINFILSYANKWGLPSPEKIEITFLLAIENYSSLYRKYLDAIEQDKNIEELYICLIMRFNIDKWTVTEKEQKIIEWNKHIEAANNEREYYKKCIENAKINILKFDKKSIIRPGKFNSLDIELHLSWDFAQQVHLPSSSQQE
ncbi:28436_t:CDS:2, partial [Gigaspora margarita]